MDGGAVDGRLQPERLGGVFGEKQIDRESRQGPVRRGRAPGVSRRRKGDAADPEGPRHRHRGRHPAGFERAGRIERFVLEPNVGDAERRADET
jgi:hypothetical protein